jgi:hypothetical protein
MRYLFALLAIAFYASSSMALCVSGRAVPGTGSATEECQQIEALKKQEKQLELQRKKIELERKQEEYSKNISGNQTANSGTIVNVGSGGLSPEAQAAQKANPLAVEAQFEAFVSSAIFELSPQQPGATRQFLTGQNSGGTALGVRYKFAKGVHLFGMYERFRYAGKEFDPREPYSGEVNKTDEYGHTIYEDGQPVKETVTLHDNSYLWATGYEHTRYLFGVGFRGIISEENMLTWTMDVMPMGWITSTYKHKEAPDEEFSASKAYGFRGSVNYHLSSDFSVSGYYQLLDAQKEAAQYADQYKPLGSQEFGVTMNFGLPNLMGVVY